MNNNLMVHVLPVTYDDYYFTATMNICNDNHLCGFCAWMIRLASMLLAEVIQITEYH